MASLRIFLHIQCLLLCIVPVLEAASMAPGTDAVRRKIDAVISQKQFNHLNAGIYAISVSTGEVIYQREADKLLIPASVSKVFTSYSLLKKLGPAATFDTKVYQTGILSKGKLTGDLYLKGGGDPSLVSERMWMLVNELVRSGIRTINGNLVADGSFFDSIRNPKSRPTYLKDQAYNAPVGGLSFNFNTTTIYAKPGDKPGDPPVVYTDPENSYIDVVNQAKTGKAGSKNSLMVQRTSFVKGDIGDTVLLRGSIPIGSNEKRFFRNIVNPTLYTAHMFRTFWERRGLVFSGNVIEGTVPKNAHQILSFDSIPIWQIIWGMNKFSNNFVADQLMKKLGAEMWGAPGTMKKGLSALHEVLEDIGIPKNAYSISDGSGLTRNTKVTAKQVTRVLQAAYQDFSVKPEFIASLGIAGEDGTLRRRMPGSLAKGKLRAKTGSLDGVTALAGYVPSLNDEIIAFAILLNDPRGKYGRMTHWADKIALALAQYRRPPAK